MMSKEAKKNERLEKVTNELATSVLMMAHKINKEKFKRV